MQNAKSMRNRKRNFKFGFVGLFDGKRMQIFRWTGDHMGSPLQANLLGRNTRKVVVKHRNMLVGASAELARRWPPVNIAISLYISGYKHTLINCNLTKPRESSRGFVGITSSWARTYGSQTVWAPRYRPPPGSRRPGRPWPSGSRCTGWSGRSRPPGYP